MSALEIEREKLAADYREQDHRLVATIEDFRRRYAAHKSRPVAAAFAAAVVPPASPVPPAPQADGGNDDAQTTLPSVSSLLDEAGAAHPSIFTLEDLRSYIDTKYPERAANISNSEISKGAWALRQGKRPKFLLANPEAKKGKGGMNTYRYNYAQYPNKK